MLDVYLRFMFGVEGVKMRRVVLATYVHVNEYSEELADSWHS